MKVHKVTLLVVDHDDIQAGGVRSAIQTARYPNHCVMPVVMNIETQEVDWHDRHPLNLSGECDAAFAKLFVNEDTRELCRRTHHQRKRGCSIPDCALYVKRAEDDEA